MKKIACVLLGVLVFAAVLGGCANKKVQVSQEMNGQQVSVEKGGTLVITLPGNPTTGYSWEASGLDETILKQAGEAKFKADSELLGAGGQVTLTFDAVSQGSTTLNLVYHRSWEKDVAPAETFTLTVEVK